MKFKETKNGNVQMTVSKEHAKALRLLLGSMSQIQATKFVNNEDYLLTYDFWDELDNFFEANINLDD